MSELDTARLRQAIASEQCAAAVCQRGTGFAGQVAVAYWQVELDMAAKLDRWERKATEVRGSRMVRLAASVAG